MASSKAKTTLRNRAFSLSPKKTKKKEIVARKQTVVWNVPDEKQQEDLHQVLSKCRKSLDELTVEAEKSRQQLTKLSEEKQEMVDYLEETLGIKQHEIEVLRDELQFLKNEKEREQQALKHDMGKLEYELSMENQRVSVENEILATKLHSLEEFRVEREKFITKIEQLESTLQHHQEEWNENFLDTQRDIILNKDRLKQDMIEHVHRLANEFLETVKYQVSESTLKVLEDNENHKLKLNQQQTLLQEANKTIEKLNRVIREQRTKIQVLEEAKRLQQAKKIHQATKEHNVEVQQSEDDISRLNKEYTEILAAQKKKTSQLEKKLATIHHQLETKNADLAQSKRETFNAKGKLATLKLLADGREKDLAEMVNLTRAFLPCCGSNLDSEAREIKKNLMLKLLKLGADSRQQPNPTVSDKLPTNAGIVPETKDTLAK